MCKRPGVSANGRLSREIHVQSHGQTDGSGKYAPSARETEKGEKRFLTPFRTAFRRLAIRTRVGLKVIQIMPDKFWTPLIVKARGKLFNQPEFQFTARRKPATA